MVRMISAPIWGLVLIFVLSNLNNVHGGAVMSIDLGNEWMKVGVVAPDVKMEIALNKESKRKTPAVVAFRDGMRSFGEDAQSVGVRFPSNTYFYLLDLLGKTIDNPIVQLYKKRFPYYEIIGDEERNTVVFKNGEEKFSVEELIAQLLTTAKEFAEDKASQQIKECVLVVPGFFGQAERNALLIAAQLANLQVLQLINDYSAVALNYGVFRRSEMNETAQYYIFYDMGAQKTSAALVSYQIVKDKTTKESNPVIQVLGVGYDRTLGGLEIQLRLRDFLAKEFNKLKKTKTDVFTSPRALAKLFKEAGRLKNVLSANAEHYAQIENLIDEQDFKLLVKREKLEELCSDLWPRVIKPVEQALKVAGLPLDVINQVVLFGGGTRVPKVQEVLRDAIKQELSRNLNADEAAAMGAVYKAADLSTGFKVKRFVIKDAVIFPLQVVFDRETNDGGVKQVKRTLFGLMNSYPQKKVITFNKNYKDFDFYVNYADINHLTVEEISYIGSLNVSRIELVKIAEIVEKHKKENVDLKGIKAHFILDDSGIFELTGVDFVVEKQQTDEDEGTLSKIGSTISKLFSVEKDKKEDDVSNVSNKTVNDTVEKLNVTDTNQNVTDSLESVKNETLKIVTIKEPIQYVLTEQFTKSLSPEAYAKSYEKLEEINKSERDRARRESALNALESYIIEARERLENDEYSSCATEDEKKQILDKCSKISEWLYEEGENADADTYEKHLEELSKLTNEVYARHWEHEERPEALKAMEEMISSANQFLDKAKTFTKQNNPDKDIFTDVEIDTLDKILKETIEWKNVETDAQNKLKRYESVKLTVKDVSDRMGMLDREVKYLINKLKIWKPKKPLIKEKNVTEEATQQVNTTEEAETEIPVIEDATFTEAPDLNINENSSSTEKTEPETSTPHVEL